MGDTLIIIPAYNEEESLPAVLKELARADARARRARGLATAPPTAPPKSREQPVSRVAELPFNLGIGGALRTGFTYAVRNGYERAVQFDADGQHDPLQVAVLLAGLDAGADMVVGSRFAEGGAVTYPVSRSRRAAMRLLEWLVRVSAGERFTDTSSGFRAFSRPMLEYFARTYPVEYMDSVEALVLACNAGSGWSEVAVNMRGRTGGAPSTRRWKPSTTTCACWSCSLSVDDEPRPDERRPRTKPGQRSRQ